MEEKNYQEEENTHSEKTDESISESINKLKQEVDSLKEEVGEMRIQELLTKMYHMMEHIDCQLQTLEDEVIFHRTNIQKSEESANTPPNTKPKPRLSEYKMLQNMLQSSNVAGPSSNQRNNLTNNGEYRGQPSNQNMFNKNIITRKSTR
ncbi:hypothetical protein ACKXGF_11380 [Alkalibacillus sp. S2W]|uniref:hypothetical protein n=1 Tax=Alkalibacillus sp. S2W TaxID=3386553 RepID=UPI00398CD3CA